MDLFGGAIKMDLPNNNFVDVSKFRTIPNHQEVWSDILTDQSIILELLDQQQDVSDENIVEFHIRELIENEFKSKMHMEFGPKQIILDNFKDLYAGIGVARCLVEKGRETMKNDIYIYVMCLRLKKQKTDVLLTLNSPIAFHPESSSARDCCEAVGSDTKQGMESFQRCCNSLKVVNWGLFK